MKLSQKDVDKALGILCVTRADMDAPLQAPTLAVAKSRLKDLKAVLKRSWRRAALELHPDRSPGREEDFKLVSAVYEEMMKLELGSPRPRPVHRPLYQTVVISMNESGGFTTNGTTDSMSTTGVWVRWS